MSIVENLRGAADLLETNGWTQNNFHEFGKHCAIGAINRASGMRLVSCWPHDDEGAEGQLAYEAAGAVADYLLDKGLVEPGNDAVFVKNQADLVADWNDLPGRTVDEVVATFRTVADQLESGDG